MYKLLFLNKQLVTRRYTNILNFLMIQTWTTKENGWKKNFLIASKTLRLWEIIPCISLIYCFCQWICCHSTNTIKEIEFNRSLYGYYNNSISSFKLAFIHFKNKNITYFVAIPINKFKSTQDTQALLPTIITNLNWIKNY